jgi:hypothetical protein
VRKIALKIWTRSTARCGRCFRALFGITVWARSLADLETLDGILNLVRVGLLGFAGRRLKVGFQRHINLPNNLRDRRIGHRLKLSLQSVSKGFGFSESETANPRVVTRGGDGVGTLITRLIILHSDCSSGLRDSSVAFHWSFLHSLSRRVTDLCRRFISAFRVGSLVTCLCLRSRFFRRISS